MRNKRTIALSILCVGLALLSYSIYALHRIAKAKGIKTDVQNFFTHNPSVWNPVIEFFGGEAQQEVSKYDKPVAIMFISGVLLTIAGAIATYRWWKSAK